MAFGFECDDGWFNLLYSAFTEIEDYFLNSFGRIPDYFYIVQVKEKWGGLRIYVSSAPQAVHDIIDKAEEQSFKTCEKCGAVGECFHRDMLPYVRTLCDKCLDEYVEERFKRKRRKDEDFISDFQKKRARS